MRNTFKKDYVQAKTKYTKETCQCKTQRSSMNEGLTKQNEKQFKISEKLYK